MEKIFADSHLTKQDIDYYIFHQANKLILDSLKEKCNLQNFNYWDDMKEYGNTVSSSIAIAIKDMINLNPAKKFHNVMLIGFGVGLSWGGCIVDLSKIN